MKTKFNALKSLAAALALGLAFGAQAEYCEHCITFSAKDPFGIYLQHGVRSTNGKNNTDAPNMNLEWSTNQVDWSKYEQQPADNFATFYGYQAGLDERDGLYKLYIRGTNNTQFAKVAFSARNSNKFTNTVNSVARQIACTGNAETLLDWKTVAKGEHPKMGNLALSYIFSGMLTLTTAPDLPATNLTTGCYSYMFDACHALTNAPAVLPAETLTNTCYQQMFKECTSLTKAPKIAAMNQAQNACNGMFLSASALKVPPKLRATNIVKNCYQSMFQKTSIELKTTGPGKPWMIPEAAVASAANANKWCHNMFSNTTSETSLLMNIEAGTQYYVASATPVALTVTAVEGASTVTVVDDGDEVSGSSPYTVYQDDEVSVTYTADEGYMFPDGKTTWTTNFTAGADAITVTLTDDQKPIPPPSVEVDVSAPEHATAAVYKDKVDPANIVPVGGTVVSNSTAYAVYTVDSDKDWYFKGDVWTKAITNQLDTSVNPAVDTNVIPAIIEVTCERAELGAGTTTNLVAGTTYTAAPTEKEGGAFNVDDGATLTGTNVTFNGNSAESGGAIINEEGVVELTQATFKDNMAQMFGGAINNCAVLNLNDVTFTNNTAAVGGAVVNEGTVNLLGPISLVTTNDTFLNFGLMNWDLTGESKGILNGYENLVNEYSTYTGTLQITIDDAILAPTNIVIATGDFTSVAGKDAFTITNATTGASVEITIDGDFVLVGNEYYSLVIVGDELQFAVVKPAKLSNVNIVDSTTGVTNATATVYVNNTQVTENPDGSYTVPEGAPIKITYTVTENALIGSCLKEKDLWLEDGIAGDHAMTDSDKKPVTDAMTPAWVEGDAGREIALDTRAHIVVASPNDVLPIAYATNHWGEIPGGAVTLKVQRESDPAVMLVYKSREDGYADWLPTLGAFGHYNALVTIDMDIGGTGSTSQDFWYGQNYQFVFDEDQMIYVQRPGDEHGLGNLDDVTSYTILNLKATPEYTNVDRYEFVSWKAYSYGERDIGWKTPEECPELAAKFGDINAAETTFEMPFTNVFLTCSYQWKSNYNEVVSVEPGIYNAWEIHEGEWYKAGIATTNGSIVSFREDIRTCFTSDSSVMNLAAGATNIWDFTKNGRPCLSYFSRVVAEAGAVNMVLFDETLTNASYRIAAKAQSALGTAFLISDGSSAQACTVVAQASLETTPWTYVGAKRFKLYVMTNKVLMLKVEPGVLQNIVIASDFSANPPFEDYNPVAGTFAWNGQVWTNGVNAFTSFTDLFTNELYATGATNISVFGTQTIAMEPATDLSWTLSLIAYETESGVTNTPILTVAKDFETDELVNITNSLAMITGRGSIVLGKTDADKSIYDDYFDNPENFAVSNVGVEPTKDPVSGTVAVDVDKDAKAEAGVQAVVLSGVENQDGDVVINVQESVTNGTLVAGNVEAPNGTVTIENRSLEELALPNAVSARDVVIVNIGRATASLYSSEGAISAADVAATGDVTITNNAHLVANVTARGRMSIYNSSKNTIVGTYAGASIELTGNYGSFSNATFTSEGPVTLTGDNMLTGPFTIDAPAVANWGTLIWDLRNDNHTPHLADFDAIAHQGSAAFAIYADNEPVIDTYVLADNAATAKNRVFSYSEWFVETNLVANGEWRYPGNSRGYMLDVTNDQLVLTIDWGVSEELRTELINTVTTNAAASIQALYDLETLSPSEIAERKDAIEKQRDATLAFLADVKVPAQARAAVADSLAFNETILNNAEWAAEARARFEKTDVSGDLGEEIEVVVYGGSKSKPSQETVTLQKNTLTSYSAYYNGKRASFPLNLNWDAGDREPKVITMKLPKSSSQTGRFLTLQLGSEAAQETVAPQVCTVTVGDPAEGDTLYARALAWPANGGKVSGYGKLNVDKYGAIKTTRTLRARANKWATFVGWYKAMTNDANQIDLASGFVTSEKNLKVGKNTDYADGTYYAFFTNVLAVAAVNLPDAKAEGATGVIGDGNIYEGTAGVRFALPISSDDEDARISVSGLPSGLKYNRKSGCIEGVPKRACVKTVKVVAKNAAGRHTATFDFEIEAMPTYAMGTFTGVVSDDVDGATHRTGVGSVVFDAGKSGKLSAKVTTRQAGTRRFSATGYNRIDENTLGIAMTNSSAEVFEATLSLTNGLYDTCICGSVYGLNPLKRGSLAWYDEGGTMRIVRNAFLKADKNEEALKILADYKGTYEATIFGTASNEVGAVTYEIANNGTVSMRAKIDTTYAGEQKIVGKTISGKVSGGFVWSEDLKRAGVIALLRSGTTIWSCEVVLDSEGGTAIGGARYVRSNTNGEPEVIDVDEQVGHEPGE